MNPLIWLSGADEETLEGCPKWEKRKYEAYGMTVLVPVCFGAISSCYAVSTVTDVKPIIYGFPFIWGFIILSIDRVLLATYRAFAPIYKKAFQFFIRIVIAGLMGLTISHPLVLLLFKDTITTEIERARQEEVNSLSDTLQERKERLNVQIVEVSELLKSQRGEHKQILNSRYVRQAEVVSDNRPFGLIELEKQVNSLTGRVDRVDKDIKAKQTLYEAEILGSRSGRAGTGPQSRMIAAQIRELSNEKNSLLSLLKNAETEKTKATKDFIAATYEINLQKGMVETNGLKTFGKQKTQMLEATTRHIENTTKELERLRAEAGKYSDYSSGKVNSMEKQKRGDMLQRTLALHHLFHQEGGKFALAVYIILTLLFTCIDTIPVLVKFFSCAGIYDSRVHEAESMVNKNVIVEFEGIDESQPILDRLEL